MILAKGNGLIAARKLDMLITEHIFDLVYMLCVSLKCGIQLFHLRIDHAHFHIDASDLRMVLSDARLEYGKTSVQILEALAHIAGLVIVHGQHDIVVANVRVIHAQQSFLQHYRLGLKLNSLERVTKLVLYLCDSCDAIGDVFAHRTSDLKEHVDGLRPELESTLQLVFFLR